MSLLTERSLRASRASSALLLASSFALSCASSGSFVWVADIPRRELSPPPEGEYVVRDGDQLEVRVVGQDAASATAHVRVDGRISVPLVGEIVARGLTTAALASQIAARLKVYFVAPVVSVSLQGSDAPKVSIVGEVARPGIYVIEPPATVIDAIALAGGLTDYASSDGVFVLREGPASALRVRFSYVRLERGEAPDAKFVLRAGDTLVVE